MNVLPVGLAGLLFEVDDLATAEALHAEIRHRYDEGRLTGVVEIVPAARTVLVTTDRHPSALNALARDLQEWQPTKSDRPDGCLVEIPVLYDGPDLAAVAELTGLTTKEVADRHADADFHIAFCGFSPGFAYIAGLPRELHVPRRTTPRTSVPSGSVALAGEFTAVYPRPSPGGWQIIGRTSTRMWDLGRESPALVSAGDRVRFVPCRSLP